MHTLNFNCAENTRYDVLIMWYRYDVGIVITSVYRVTPYWLLWESKPETLC